MSDIVPIDSKLPRYDQNFLINVQTNSEVPADVLSRLISAFDAAGIGVQVTYVGTIDYEVINTNG